MANESIPRRSLLARLGFAGAGMLVAARSASASGRETAGEPTQDPALHELDRWLTPLTAPSRQLIDIRIGISIGVT